MKTLYLFDRISLEMAAGVIEVIQTTVHKQIRVFLSSEGGSLGAGLAIYDALRTKDATIIATGCCESAAMLILQAGKTRLATPNAYFLVHEVSFDGEPTPDTDAQTRVLAVKIAETIASKLTPRINITPDTAYKQALNRILFVPHALNYGLIDGVYGDEYGK